MSRVVVATWVAIALATAVTMVILGPGQNPGSDLYDPITGTPDLAAFLVLFSSWFLLTFIGGSALCFGAGALAKALTARRSRRAKRKSADGDQR